MEYHAIIMVIGDPGDYIDYSAYRSPGFNGNPYYPTY